MTIQFPQSNQSNQSNQSYQCYLGLGGNLTNEIGTPIEHIVTAITRLSEHPQINNVQRSSLYVSEAYGVTDQPEFINTVVGCETDLSPHELLTFCQTLENSAKRERLRYWGERSLDVDILLYGAEVIDTDDLTIPHVELAKRNFVLVPLLEIVPQLAIQGKLLADMPMSHDWTGLRVL